jgi:hypothetical protein
MRVKRKFSLVIFLVIFISLGFVSTMLPFHMFHQIIFPREEYIFSLAFRLSAAVLLTPTYRFMWPLFMASEILPPAKRTRTHRTAEVLCMVLAVFSIAKDGKSAFFELVARGLERRLPQVAHAGK